MSRGAWGGTVHFGNHCYIRCIIFRFFYSLKAKSILISIHMFTVITFFKTKVGLIYLQPHWLYYNSFKVREKILKVGERYSGKLVKLDVVNTILAPITVRQKMSEIFLENFNRISSAFLKKLFVLVCKSNFQLH